MFGLTALSAVCNCVQGCQKLKSGPGFVVLCDLPVYLFLSLSLSVSVQGNLARLTFSLHAALRV